MQDVEVVTEVATKVVPDAIREVVFYQYEGKLVSTSTVFKNLGTPTVAPSSESSSVYVPPSSPPASTTILTPSTAPEPSTPAVPSSFSEAPSSPNAVVSSTSAPQPSSSTPVPPPPSSAPVPSSTIQESTSTPPPTPVSSSSPSVPTGGIVSNAIGYSPYNPDNSCKTPNQVAQDLAQIESYEVIRLYGTDCDQTANVVAATKDKNTKIFQGIFDITQIPNEVELISKAVNGNWGLISTVNVGNELVRSGTDPSTVISAIDTARLTLKSAGYTGPVVTVDTMVTMNSTISLCKASDFCAINCHPFFDTHTAANEAGDFVQMWVGSISKQSGKTVVVTETGWPTGGDSHDLAVPSKENQEVAIASLKSAMPQNMILFSAYNTPWKKDNSGTHGAEKYWGIHGQAPSD